jgi:hypothetical protein
MIHITTPTDLPNKNNEETHANHERGKINRRMHAVKDENGRKRSVNTKIITVFIFFIGNKIENGNSGNGNDIGISKTSETKVQCGKYTVTVEIQNTIGKHIKLHNKTKLTKDHKDHTFIIHDITSSQGSQIDNINYKDHKFTI